MQDGVSFEHIVLDAGSSDSTRSVVAEFSDVTFIQEPDRGMSDGINKGFLRARGEWIMWLNADDRLRPGALRAVLSHARSQPDAAVIYGCWNFMNESGVITRRMTLFPFDRAMLQNYGCYIASTSTFIRKTAVIDEGYLLNIGFKSVMDGEYYCRLASMGKQFSYLPTVLADFRLHDASISQRNLHKMDIDGVLAYQRQQAESRAIRRVYGIRLFKDEMMNVVVEGVLFHIYRIKKGIMRLIHSQSCTETNTTSKE